MPKWWDDGRSPYEPDNPFMNTNMIWIPGVAGYALVAFLGIGVAIIDWIAGR